MTRLITFLMRERQDLGYNQLSLAIIPQTQTKKLPLKLMHASVAKCEMALCSDEICRVSSPLPTSQGLLFVASVRVLEAPT